MNFHNTKIGLFIPCYVDQLYPQVGIATLELLQKLGLDVYYPLKQTCCGQPLSNSGAEQEAIKTYHNFINNFKEFEYVVSPSGSCVYHVRKHYDILEQTDELKKVRANTYEFCEFLVDILGVEDLKIHFPHIVGVHQSCHGLRGLKLGKPYKFSSGFVFETQGFPDAPNHLNFPSIILNPGGKYSHITMYKFTLVSD